MHKHIWVAGALALLLPCFAFPRDKQKSSLPYDVLHATTVSVVIDPNAGESLDDPRANEVAQRDVETALLNWGRYQPILDGPSADLIIVIRRGTGKMAGGTVHDPRQGRRPGAIDPMDGGVDIGMQRGQPPPYAGDIPDASQGSPIPNQGSHPMDRVPHPQTEIGNAASEDSFLVYRGKIDNPLNNSPVWRYVAKDCLKPHKVPAVDAFHKAVVEADQAASKQP
jgi:hypothetical protein